MSKRYDKMTNVRLMPTTDRKLRSFRRKHRPKLSLAKLANMAIELGLPRVYQPSRQ